MIRPEVAFWSAAEVSRIRRVVLPPELAQLALRSLMKSLVIVAVCLPHSRSKQLVVHADRSLGDISVGTVIFKADGFDTKKVLPFK